jgi:hypothetical protein
MNQYRRTYAWNSTSRTGIDVRSAYCLLPRFNITTKTDSCCERYHGNVSHYPRYSEPRTEEIK